MGVLLGTVEVQNTGCVGILRAVSVRCVADSSWLLLPGFLPWCCFAGSYKWCIVVMVCTGNVSNALVIYWLACM